MTNLRPGFGRDIRLDGIEFSVEVLLKKPDAYIDRNAVPTTGAHDINALLFGLLVILQLHAFQKLWLS